MGLMMVAVGGCRVCVCHEKLETHVIVTCHGQSICEGWAIPSSWAFLMKIYAVIYLTFMNVEWHIKYFNNMWR